MKKRGFGLAFLFVADQTKTAGIPPFLLLLPNGLLQLLVQQIQNLDGGFRLLDPTFAGQDLNR